MALNTKVGQFTLVSGSQTIDPGFSMVGGALILWTCGRTADGSGGEHARLAYGHGTYRGSTAVQMHWCLSSTDNAGTSDCYVGSSTASILKLTNGSASTVVTNVALTSFGAGGFTLNCTTATLLPVVNYVAIAGSDLVDALAGSFTIANAATTNVTVASGFGTPDLILFPLSWNGTTAPSTADSDTSLGFGVKAGAVNGRSVRWGSADAVATQATGQQVNNNRALTLGTANGLDTAFQVSASSAFPTDGFQITRNNGTATFPIFYLALRFSANVTVTTGETAARTTTGVSTLTSADTPALAFVLGTMQTTANTMDTTSATCAEIGIGAIDGAGAEASCGCYDDDAQATASVCGTWQSGTKTYRTVTTSTDAVDSEADGQVNGSNFELNFTDAAASAWLYEWFTLGVLTSAATPIPDVVMAPLIHN